MLAEFHTVHYTLREVALQRNVFVEQPDQWDLLLPSQAPYMGCCTVVLPIHWIFHDCCRSAPTAYFQDGTCVGNWCTIDIDTLLCTPRRSRLVVVIWGVVAHPPKIIGMEEPEVLKLRPEHYKDFVDPDFGKYVVGESATISQ
eukprot:SAG11_NODE_361_length_10183_cov_4.077053_2_plen_143_part_00